MAHSTRGFSKKELWTNFREMLPERVRDEIGISMDRDPNLNITRLAGEYMELYRQLAECERVVSEC